MNIHYVTYATHEHGLFKELINNKYKIPIKVLGWNTKWNGFMDKIKAIKEYTESKHSNDIIVFLDGFDTIINKDPKNLVNLFKQFNKQILVSEDSKILGNYVANRVFGNCVDKRVANSGLYMGYAPSINKMCKLMINESTSDDQRALNSVCEKLDIAVDVQQIIFKNITDNSEKGNSIFVSYPGATMEGFTGKAIRYYRSIKEYSPYLKEEIFLLLLILLAFYYRKYIINKIKPLIQKIKN